MFYLSITNQGNNSCRVKSLSGYLKWNRFCTDFAVVFTGPLGPVVLAQ